MYANLAYAMSVRPRCRDGEPEGGQPGPGAGIPDAVRRGGVPENGQAGDPAVRGYGEQRSTPAARHRRDRGRGCFLYGCRENRGTGLSDGVAGELVGQYGVPGYAQSFAPN